jgi:hypothetical protein
MDMTRAYQTPIDRDTKVTGFSHDCIGGIYAYLSPAEYFFRDLLHGGQENQKNHIPPLLGTTDPAMGKNLVKTGRILFDGYL